MAEMTPERWQQVDAALDAALDRPTADRGDYVRGAYAHDDALRAEVERLLAAHEREAGPLAVGGDRPAAVYAAPLAASADPRSIGRVGPWRLLDRAGEGGMGTVYVAERDDGAFRMRVALKLVRDGLHRHHDFVRRFHDERQILARLDHPGIARLLDGGLAEDGRPYYVMELVAGQPIDRWCDAACLTLGARLAVFARACDAVAAAHAARIVHRDVKPSNILVSAEGEPKLLDFGIAKLIDPALALDAAALGAAALGAAALDAPALTRTGQRILTPEYASPEQLRGEPVSPATDVWALGVLLYELLTGRPPFAHAGRPLFAVERAVLDEEPARPSRRVVGHGDGDGDAATPAEVARRRAVRPEQLRRALRGDLDAIVLTALRKEPGRRYASAAELAADVRRHLGGVPVRAQGDGIGYRVRKLATRHRGVLAAGVVGLVAGTAVLALLEHRAGGGVSLAAPGADRYYEDGLRARSAGNWDEAVRLLDRALAEDSTRALAAMYASEAASRDEDYPTMRARRALALRLAARAPEHERLLVHAYQAARFQLPTLRAYADSLAARYPRRVEGEFFRASAAAIAGDYLDAARGFRRVATRDSLTMARDGVPCMACEARELIVHAYGMLDSLETAEREAVLVTRLRPAASMSWQWLAQVRLLRGSDDTTAYRRAVELDPTSADYAAEWLALRHMRRAEFAQADEVLRGRMRSAPGGREERAMFALITSLRYQARWPEALALARQYRAREPDAPPGTAPPSAVHEAQVLFESGRPAASAALYDSISRSPRNDVASFGARAWQLAHAADAFAAAGDTAALARVADTLAVLGPRTVSGRDRRLPLHARGLLLAARGDHAGAAAMLARAIGSPNQGFTRTNLALARERLALGQPLAAVAALQPALRGTLEGSNYYATHTEIHAALAAAWSAAGNADSAAAHRAWVDRARRRPPRVATP